MRQEAGGEAWRIQNDELKMKNVGFLYPTKIIT